MPAPKKPSEEILNHIRENFKYDVERGILEIYHRGTGKWQINTSKVRELPGKTLFHEHRSVISIRLDGTARSKPKAVQYSHVCWFLYYGEWPNKSIDHIDRDASNNKISNLRLASSALQGLNRYRINKLLPGVSYVKANKYNPYTAHIRVDGKATYLGAFRKEEEAHLAYRNKYKELYGQELPPYMQWKAPKCIEVDPITLEPLP